MRSKIIALIALLVALTFFSLGLANNQIPDIAKFFASMSTAP